MKDDPMDDGNPRNAEELDPRETQALRDLGGPVDPPAGLADDVVEALTREELIRSRAPVGAGGPGWRRPTLAAAAAVVLFVAGWATGRRWPGEPPPAGTPAAGVQDPSGADHLAAQPLFALLLVNSPGYDWPVDGGMPARIEEYAAWARELDAQGRLVLAEALAPSGAVLTPTTAAADVGPQGQVQRFDDIELGQSTGLFIVRARDEAHALELARESPHFRHGGEVTVRRILPT